MANAAFLAELDQWGPAALAGRATPSLEDSRAFCRRLATSHYENFPLVSCLLPPGLQQHFYNVYAWCRWADDLGDEVGDRDRSLDLLAWWEQELDDCYAGQSRHPVFVALAETIREFQIPREPFADLISAFVQDQSITEYLSFEQLRDYCRRSADPVGRIVLHLCRCVGPQEFAWSDSICTGLQLANFWQDVLRDFSIGRIYLPRDDYEQFGYRREDFDRRLQNEAFLELMRFEVDRAREFLSAGLPLVERLPGRLQVDIDLFARGGLRILQRIAKIRYRVWDVRPEVTKRDALLLLGGAPSRAALCFCTTRRRGSSKATTDPCPVQH